MADDDDDLAAKLAHWRSHPGTFAGRLRRAGSSSTKVVPHERDGRPAGTQTEHWDGRVDADVHLRTVTMRTRISEGGTDGA